MIDEDSILDDIRDYWDGIITIREFYLRLVMLHNLSDSDTLRILDAAAAHFPE